MYIIQYLTKTTSYLTFLIFLTAVVGDYIVAYSKLHIFQALFDNATHFLIAGLSWLIVCLHDHDIMTSRKILEVACCSILGSLIDLDHFIEARSFHIKDATNLKHRPFLHCSTFPLIGCALSLAVGYYSESWSLKRCSLIIWTAFASHHTRDATRRGYWFYPFGSTLAIPYMIYIGISCILPHFVLFVNNCLKITVDGFKVLQTTVI